MYSEESGGARTLAEEGYHPIVEALRIGMPEDFGRVKEWHALRPGHAEQEVVEGFAQVLTAIEVEAIKGESVIRQARGLPAIIDGF